MLRNTDIHGRYGFEQLPKGSMCGFVMNPYNGNVFLEIEKHASSTAIALEIMREVVSVCGFLERNGSSDPLRDLILAADAGEYENLLRAARDEIEAKRVFAVRKVDVRKRKAS